MLLSHFGPYHLFVIVKPILKILKFIKSNNFINQISSERFASEKCLDPADLQQEFEKGSKLFDPKNLLSLLF